MFPIVYLNGEYLAAEQASLGLNDLSILRGYGIFDFFRYTEGKPRFLEDHINRFFNSARLMDLPFPIAREALVEVVHQLIKRNHSADGGIRFVMTGGYSPNAYTIAKPNLMAMAYPFVAPDESLFTQGCKVLLHEHERQLPEVKTTDYIEGIRLLPRLKAKQAHFPLYVDRVGNVRESDRSNFFIVQDGVLVTPAKDILMGITRMHIIKLAKQLGLTVVERAVSVAALLAADEAIIASSTKGVMPITKIDDYLVGDGQPGEITRRLLAAWPAYYRAS